MSDTSPGFQANPGLEFANAFSVQLKLHRYEVFDKLQLVAIVRKLSM